MDTSVGCRSQPTVVEAAELTEQSDRSRRGRRTRTSPNTWRHHWPRPAAPQLQGSWQWTQESGKLAGGIRGADLLLVERRGAARGGTGADKSQPREPGRRPQTGRGQRRPEGSQKARCSWSAGWFRRGPAWTERRQTGPEGHREVEWFWMDRRRCQMLAGSGTDREACGGGGRLRVTRGGPYAGR